MSVKKILLMAILLSGLAALLYLGERQGDEAPLQESQEKLLGDISANDIQKLHLIHPENSFGIFRRTDTEPPAESRWVLREPEGAPTIAKEVEALLTALTTLAAQNVIPAEVVDPTAGVYGLEPPVMLVSLDGSFGKRVVSFGKKHEISGRRYAQIENDARIFLIDETAFEAISRGKEDLRSRQPLQFPVQAVRSVTVLTASNDTPIVLRKQAEDGSNWSMQFGKKTSKADAGLIVRQLRELSEIKVDRFLAPSGEPMQAFGLDYPLLILRIELENESGPKELLLQFGQGAALKMRNKEQTEELQLTLYYFKVSFQNWIYQLKQPAFRGWVQSPEYFQDRAPFEGIAEAGLQKIEIKRGLESPEKFSLALDKESGAWRFSQTQDSSVAVSQRNFEEWLEKLSQLQILSYPAMKAGDESLLGIDAPRLSLRLSFAPEVGSVTLLIGRPIESVQGRAGTDAPRYGAIVGADGVALPIVISSAALLDLDQPGSFFREKKK